MEFEFQTEQNSICRFLLFSNTFPADANRTYPFCHITGNIDGSSKWKHRQKVLTGSINRKLQPKEENTGIPQKSLRFIFFLLLFHLLCHRKDKGVPDKTG